MRIDARLTSRLASPLTSTLASRLVACLFVVCLFGAASVEAGVRLQLEQRRLAGAGTIERSELILEGHRLKMTRQSKSAAMGDEVLFDGEEGKLWVIDRKRRSYLEMDRETLKATGDQLSSAMAQMQAQLKSLPPEQRAMVEQAMKGRMPAAATTPPSAPEEEYRPTGDRAEKGGYPCRRVEVWSEGRKTREHWVTDWKELELTRSDLAALEELGAFVKELGSAMGGKHEAPDPLRVSEKMGGLPIVTVDLVDGRPSSETRLVGLERAAIPASELRLPEGYTPSAMPGLPTR